MIPGDQGARYAAKELDAEGFLRWLLPEAFVRRRWTSWLDTQGIAFPGEAERRCDTVAVFERWQDDAVPCATVIEFMSRPRGDTPERLAEYTIRIRRELPFHVEPPVPFEVIPVLVNLTGPPQTATWTMTPADFGGLGLSVRMKVITLREQDGRELLAGIAAGQISLALLPWVPLMKGGDESEVVDEWCRLALTEKDARRRGDYGGLARVFADMADREDIWRPKLEGWNVEESMVVREWQDKARNEFLGTMQTELLAIARSRFKTEPSPDVLSAVKAQRDPMTLHRWLRLAEDSPDLTAFRSGIGLK